MPEARKRPCTICRRWFRPDPRARERQHACGKPECQTKRRQETQASWRRRNPDYGIAYRIDQRSAQTQPPPEVLRVPTPLNQLPWEFAKDQFGPQCADFIAVLAGLLVRFAKDQFRAHRIDSTRLSGTLPRFSQKTSADLDHTEPRAGDDATGVSPTRPAMGASASPRAAPAAPAAGV